MSLQEQIIRQRDFSAGEVDPDAVRRDDVEPLKYAVRYARNLVSTHTGALTRRPGRRFLFEDYGVVGDFKPFDDIAYTIVFVAGGFKARTADGSLVANLAAPWADSDLDTLVFEAMDNEIFVAWDGRTKVIKIAEGSNAWSVADYEFSTGLDGARRMPFFRFEATRNITMKVSAVTGSGVTVTFSAAVLDAAHVGALFRYAGRQLRITSVTSSKVGKATIVEELPPTWAIVVADSSGFSVGQIVETDLSGFKGEVTKIAGTTVTVVAIDKLITPDSSEKLIGPSASSAISSVSVIAPAATLQWDEQFVSNYRGWPRSVSKDRQRLIMSNFSQKKNAIFWLAAGDNRDGEIGADADSAMLEYISAECQVFHVVGGYDEFAVTDRGVYYIPVSVGTPLQPGSVEFRPIFTNELANIRPIEVTEGLIFVDKSLTGIYAITATGQTARPYIANEINRLHRHLFEGVISIAATSGTSRFPSRQIYAVNTDGTVVVGQFNPDREYVGWLKWNGMGSVRSVAGTYGKVVFMSVYTLDGDEFGIAEELDYTLLSDCSKTINSSIAADFIELNDGTPLELNDGSSLELSGVVADFYRGKTVSVFAGGFYFPGVVVPMDGIISGFAEYEDITLGIDFAWTLHPLFTNFEGGQAVGQGEQRRKVEHMLMTVRETQEFQCGNRIYGSYRGGEDTSLPVPLRDDTYKYRETGRSYDPVVPFTSTFPGAFKLIELTTRITV